MAEDLSALWEQADPIQEVEDLSSLWEQASPVDEAPILEKEVPVAPPEVETPERTIAEAAKDIGVSALKGAISLPQAAVGLLDIPTGGHAGKLLEEAGYRPEEAKAFLDTFLSPAQQTASKEVAEAEGFLPTIQAAIENPSVIAQAVIESAPSMIGGAGIARGVMKIAPRLGALVAGAFGEGAVAAGMAAEELRSKAETGLVTPEESLKALGSGVGTGLFGLLGGRVAQKLGITDVETLLAGGIRKQTEKSVVRRIVEGGVSEGLLEELPQSIQETMWMNSAEGRPLTEGVGSQAAMGMLAGVAMGGGFNVIGGAGVETPPPNAVKSVIDELITEGLDPAVGEDMIAKFEEATSPEMTPEENIDLLGSLMEEAGVGVEEEAAAPEVVVPEKVVPEEIVPETVEERITATTDNVKVQVAETLDAMEPTTELGAQIKELVQEEMTTADTTEEIEAALPEEVAPEEIVPEEVIPEITPRERAYSDAALSLGVDTEGKAVGQVEAEVRAAIEATATPEEDLVSPEDRRADYGKRQEVERLFAAGDIDGAQDLIFRDGMTGNLNKRAFEHDEPQAIEQGKVFASIDMSGLKWVNDTFGHDFGDDLLKLMGDSLGEVSGENSYRIGGDEYAGIFDNEEQAGILLNKVKEELAGRELEVITPDGVKRIFKGWGFDYATANTYSEADKKLTKFRTKLKAEGKRVGRGGEPLGLAEVTAERIKSKAPAKKEVTPKEPPAKVKVAPEKKTKLQEKYAAFLGDVATRYAQEARGQEILDDLDESDITPKNVSDEFWGETYFNLPTGVQSKFHKYLKDLFTEPGGHLTKTEIAESWLDVAEALAPTLPKSTSNLEDIERGYVALMAEANARFKEVKSKRAPRPADKIVMPSAIKKREAEVKPKAVKEPTPKFPEFESGRVKIGKSPQGWTILSEETTPEEKAAGERYFEIESEKTGEKQTVTFEEMKPLKKRIVTEEALEKAKAGIKEKMGGLRAGVDPTLLKEYAIIGAYHFESGFRSFGAWSKRMVKEFGKTIKPHLEDLWGKAKKAPKEIEVMAAREAIEKKVTPTVKMADLRKAFGAGPLPIKETEEVYDTTSEEMTESAQEDKEDLKKSPEVKTYKKEAKGKYKGFVERVSKTFDKLDPIGSLPEKAAYLKSRYLTLGKIAEINEASKEIYEAFAKAGDQTQNIYDYLTNADIKPSSIKGAELRKSAIEVKNKIIQTGEELVKRGLLDKQTFLSHKGSYLPRIYLKHLMPGDVFQSMSDGGKLPDLGYLKKRKDIPEEVRRLILGEMTDPGYLASKGYGVQMRDMALIDWLAEISENSDWTLDESLVEWKGQKVTPFWLKNESDRIRRQAKYYLEADRKEALEISEQMGELADEALGDRPGVPHKYKQVPDTPRYGTLRGMIVREEIYDDIVGASTMHLGDTSIAEQILGNGGVATKFTQLWKWSKVAANPPGQVRNFVSNGILLHLSGVPSHKVPARVIEAVRDIRKNGKYWQAAKKYGVTESTFGSQELVRIERELLDIEAKRHGAVSLATLKNIGGKIIDLTGDMYQMSESIFKTAKIVDEMKKGKNPADAALEAQKWLFDYSLVTPSMKYLRNAPVGVPFLTFYLKALPRMLEVLLTNPVKFAPYMAIPYAMTHFIAGMTDVDDDDVDKLRKALPKWLEERGNAYILPAKDEQGRWQAIDIGYFLPWATWSDMAQELGKGEIDDALLSTGLFGGPVPDMITAIKTNIDPFTKKEIVNKYDSPAKQIASIMGYLYQMAAPTWLTNIGFAGHMKRALDGTVDKYGEPKTNKTQAALRLVGVNLYPIDPMRTRRANIRWMQFEISQVKRRMSSLLKDKNFTAKERKKIRKEYRDMIRKRQDEIRTYRKESRVHPRLR